jgi:hypothetical protein
MSLAHNIVRHKVWWLFTLVTCCFLLLAAQYAWLKIRVGYALGQVTIFQEMRVSAERASDPNQIAGFLEYVVDYYPSGSKQNRGSCLDVIVENARSNASAAIVARLRIVTGKDLGADPDAWLRVYGKNEGAKDEKAR